MRDISLAWEGTRAARQRRAEENERLGVRQQIRVSGWSPARGGGRRRVFYALALPDRNLNERAMFNYRKLAVTRFRIRHPDSAPAVSVRVIEYTEEIHS